jgi:hypothetical protein
MAIAIPHPLLCKNANTAQGFQSRGPGFHAAILILALSAFLGCGVPGAPLPPSAEIPKFVGDLKAQRKGETVTLAWTTPTETSDGELIRKPGKMLVQRALSSGQADLQFQTISELPLPPTLNEGRAEQATAKDTLTDALRSGGAEFAVYSILAQGRNGKSFGLPNRVSVPLRQSLPPPKNVSANLVPTGVMLKWEEDLPQTAGPQEIQQFKVMRRLQGSNEAVLVKQVNASAFGELVDNTIEWEKTYQYWITPITLWQNEKRKGVIEGDDSAIVEILAHDSFPPAAPAGLQAVFSAMPQNSFIDLTWTGNTEPDLAGYNVYRHSGDGPPVKINPELVKTPRFPDPNIQPGMKYFYSVTAVDLRGNESGKSEETSETVPKD